MKSNDIVKAMEALELELALLKDERDKIDVTMWSKQRDLSSLRNGLGDALAKEESDKALEAARAAGLLISWDQVEATYQGQDGCACGCGGTYARPENESEVRTAKARLNRMNKAIAAGTGGLCQEGIYEASTGETSVVRVYVKGA